MPNLLKQFNIFIANLKGNYFMWQSRDISLVIVTAVAVFVSTLLIFQYASVLTGIVGANYIFTIGMAFFVSLTFLLFEGRKWRFFLHNTLVALLTLPTTLGGPPYDIFPRLILVLVGVLADLLFNSFYKVFKNRNQLVYWSIIVGAGFFLILPFFQILFFPVFFPPQFVENFTRVVILMLPWIIAGGVAGGYLGFKIYDRVS